jgi:hypothetical protein
MARLLRHVLTDLVSAGRGRRGPVGLRGRLLGRFLGGDPRRWILYLLAGSVWRFLRSDRRGTAEPLYRATLGSGRRVSLATSDPLPRKLRTRAVRRALEAAYRAEAG